MFHFGRSHSHQTFFPSIQPTTLCLVKAIPQHASQAQAGSIEAVRGLLLDQSFLHPFLNKITDEIGHINILRLGLGLQEDF